MLNKTYLQIVILDFNDFPLKEFSGSIISGSISIDGKSSVARSCNFSIKVSDPNFSITQGLNTKMKLTLVNEEFGKVPINIRMGTYIANGISINNSINSSTISFSGKDKMSLLNGELGGKITDKSVDFGTEEFYDTETQTTTIYKIPIKKIITEAVHFYAKEPYYNIIVNDLDDLAVDLLQYNGDAPLYIFKQVETQHYVNYTTDPNFICYINGEPREIKDLIFENRVDLYNNESLADKVTFNPNDDLLFTVSQVQFGETAGYRISDLIYAGDLILNSGETITTLLDKIVNMLGNFEYFYDLDGRFVFQRKRNFLDQTWTNIKKTPDNEVIIQPAMLTLAKSLDLSSLAAQTSLGRNIDLKNLKNDYTIWGERISPSGATVPVHYRYAIDEKPTKYVTLEINEEDIKEFNLLHPDAPLKTQISTVYTSDKTDWREIIYQMAKDYYAYHQLDCFTAKLIDKNPSMINGISGYEQYYTDLQAFWRELFQSELDLKQKREEIAKLQLEIISYQAACDFGEYEKQIDSLDTEIKHYQMQKNYEADRFKNVISNALQFFNRAFVLTEEQKEQAEAGTYRAITEAQLSGALKENGWYAADDLILIKAGFLRWLDKELYEAGFPSTKKFSIGDNETAASEAIMNSFNKFFIDLFTPELSTPEEELIVRINSILLDKEAWDYYYAKGNEEHPGFLRIYGDLSAESKEMVKKSIEEYYSHLLNLNLNYNNKVNDVIALYTNIRNALALSLEQKRAELDAMERQLEQKQNILDGYDSNGWNKLITTDPSLLNFWIDFMPLDQNAYFYPVSVKQIGSRQCVVNDSSIGSVYQKETPQILFANKFQLNDVKR